MGGAIFFVHILVALFLFPLIFFIMHDGTTLGNKLSKLGKHWLYLIIVLSLVLAILPFRFGDVAEQTRLTFITYSFLQVLISVLATESAIILYKQHKWNIVFLASSLLIGILFLGIAINTLIFYFREH